MQPMGVDLVVNFCVLLVRNTLPLKRKQGFLILDTPPDFALLCGACRIKQFHVTTELPRGVELGTHLPYY